MIYIKDWGILTDLLKFFIDVRLIYSIVLVSGMQHSDSFFFIFFIFIFLIYICSFSDSFPL